MLTNDNEESRRMVEHCYKRHKTTVNPIIDWTDADVWTFIRANGIRYCELYNEGFHRLGCIGCPLASKIEREMGLRRWPFAERAYLVAFEKMLKVRFERGKMGGPWRIGTTAQNVMDWWLERRILPGQMNLFEEELKEMEDTDD